MATRNSNLTSTYVYAKYAYPEDADQILSEFEDYMSQDPASELFAADCCNASISGGAEGLVFWQQLPRTYSRRWPKLRKFALRTLGQSSSESDSERHFSRAAHHQPPGRSSLSVGHVGKLAFVREEILSEIEELASFFTLDWLDELADFEARAPPPPPALVSVGINGISSGDVSTTDDEQDDDGDVGATNLGSGDGATNLGSGGGAAGGSSSNVGGGGGGGGSSSNVGGAAAAAKASAAAALLKQAHGDSFMQQRDAHFGSAEENDRVLATLAAPAGFLSQQEMQEAVHSIQPGYGNADQLPSIEEWIAILMQSDNVVVKTKLVSLIGQHDNWFFGPKLQKVFAAVAEVRNREL